MTNLHLKTFMYHFLVRFCLQYTNSQHNHRFMALCPGLPRWAGTRRNTHHPPSWSSPNLYHLLPSTTIHTVQIACLAIFLHSLNQQTEHKNCKQCFLYYCAGNCLYVTHWHLIFWLLVTYLSNSEQIQAINMNCYVCRVLLRVRLLYYLKQEVIGQQADKIFSGAPARHVFLQYSSLFTV